MTDNTVLQWMNFATYKQCSCTLSHNVMKCPVHFSVMRDKRGDFDISCEAICHLDIIRLPSLPAGS